MSKNKIYIIAIMAIISASFLLLAKSVQAESATSTASTTGQGTIVSYRDDSGRISEDRIWTKEGSPYYINEGVSIDAKLTVEPGVEIIGVRSPTTGLYGSIFVSGPGGQFIVKGKRDDRIKISNVNTIYASYGGVVDIANTDISDVKDKIYFFKAKANIATSTIKTSNIGLQITDSEVSVWGSRFENNNQSIKIVGNYIYPDPSILPMRVRINNNAIITPNGYSLRDSATEYMDLKNNWWGSDSGPSQDSSSNTGLMVYSKFALIDPWLTSEPPFDPEPKIVIPECCSNVLFIPGLQASRLYRDEFSASDLAVYGVGTSTKKLWEPMKNADVKALYNDNNGTSLDPTIYPGGPIDNVFGINIYGKFMEYLDSLKSSGKIKDWKSYGYDWRKSIAEVVAGDKIGGLDSTSTTTSLLQTVQDLASSSPTGKVTLVAHSNGGLVMKYLVKTLDEMGKSDLVDKAISVAVPYIGTPKAILGLLHGYDQSMALGLILKESTARGLGENMSSAYSLLPSMEYFKKVLTPTIAFASTTVTEVNDGSYPASISSQEIQSAFIEDKNNVRPIPSFADTARPIKGNSALNILATYIHGLLDPFVWPATIARYAIVGWGQDTPSGIIYDNKQKCSGLFAKKVCVNVPTYKAEKTKNGDGTVVAESASYNDGTVVSIQLGSDSPDTDLKDKNHANILSSGAVQNIIGDIVTRSNTTQNTADIISNISAMSGISIGEKDRSVVDSNTKQIIVSTHSPVRLDVYDEYGNHTGDVLPPAGVEAGLYVSFEEKIPGSKYERTGDENEPDTYITLPEDGNKYSVKISGVGTGEFAYRVERQRGSVITDKVEYSNLPVTPLMVASTTVVSDPSSVPGTTLASSSQPLNIDINGDSIVDAKIIPNNKPDRKLFLKLLKKSLEKKDDDEHHTRDLIKQIEKEDEGGDSGKRKDDSGNR